MLYKIIFSPQLAKHLLKHGYRIFDIKADRENSLKTIFVFETDSLDSLMNEVRKFQKNI